MNEVSEAFEKLKEEKFAESKPKYMPPIVEKVKEVCP